NWSLPFATGGGSVSLSMMVSVALVGVPSVAPPVALVSVRTTVSLPSTRLSSRIGTVNVLLALSPAAQGSVSLTAVKSTAAGVGPAGAVEAGDAACAARGGGGGVGDAASTFARGVAGGAELDRAGRGRRGHAARLERAQVQGAAVDGAGFAALVDDVLPRDVL